VLQRVLRRLPAQRRAPTTQAREDANSRHKQNNPSEQEKDHPEDSRHWADFDYTKLKHAIIEKVNRDGLGLLLN
jgi:hypothetical protein